MMPFACPRDLAFVLSLATACGAASGADAGVIRNGDFSKGTAGWSGFASDGTKEVAVVDAAGGSALLLGRTERGAKVQVVQFNIRLRPQTLYRLSVTGYGDARAAVSFRPSSSSDSDYAGLCKSWATSSSPMGPSKGPETQTFLFDSGLKADDGFVALRLAGKEPGEYRFTSVAMVEAGSSKPSTETSVIAHIGDSITITSYLPFTSRVDALLQAMFGRLPGTKVRNLNLGVDGEYVGELLDTGRYDKVIRENYKQIDVAIIRYGANDQRKYSVEEFEERLRVLCGRLERDYPGVRVVLGTGPYLHEADWVNRQQYGPYWQALRELATERHYHLVDIYKRFEAEGAFKTVRAKGDMHPSEYGVRLIADEQFKVLQQVLRERR